MSVRSDSIYWDIFRNPRVRDITVLRNILTFPVFLRQRTGVTVGSNLVFGYITAAPGEDNLWACPFILPQCANITRLGTWCQTAGTAAARARIGLYTSDGNLYPATLIVDGGEVNCSATGLKEVVVNVTLEPGVYWVAVDWNEAAIGWYLLNSGSPYLIGSALDSHLGWQVVQAYGALPANYPGGGANNRSPIGFYQIASYI